MLILRLKGGWSREEGEPGGGGRVSVLGNESRDGW